MKNIISPEDLGHLANYFNDMHNGDLIEIARHLDHIIYQLHYIPEGTVSPHSIQQNCFLLVNMRELLLEIHYTKSGKAFVRMCA